MLEPIATDSAVVEDGGIPFVIHTLARLERKAQVTTQQRETGTNPFLPPDPELFVAELSDTHSVVLNRFNVLDHHLLIVTRRFVHQLERLDLSDFEALCLCMSEVDGLGFYNAGMVAGASQPHKHLQLVPLPLGSGPRPTPLDAVMNRATPKKVIHRIEAFRFPHALIRLEGTPISSDRADELFDNYHRLLKTADVTDSSIPYNLIVTKNWMLMVPRRREFFEGISVNALGFAGSLLVRDQEQFELVRRFGPLHVLQSVVV
jgi:ATP adenylyltransferase